MQHHTNQTLDQIKTGTTRQLWCSNTQSWKSGGRKIGIKYDNYQKTKRMREILVPSLRPQSIQSNSRHQKKCTNSPEGGDRNHPQRLHCTEETQHLTETLYFDSVSAFKVWKNKHRRERKIGRWNR